MFEEWCVAIFVVSLVDHFLVVVDFFCALLLIAPNSDRYDFHLEFIDTYFSWNEPRSEFNFECVAIIVKNWQNYQINVSYVSQSKRWGKEKNANKGNWKMKSNQRQCRLSFKPSNCINVKKGEISVFSECFQMEHTIK